MNLWVLSKNEKLLLITKYKQFILHQIIVVFVITGITISITTKHAIL